MKYLDAFMLRLFDGDLDKDHTKSKSFVSWEKRYAKAWWRGTLIAPSTTLASTAQYLPRVRLSRLAAESPGLFDVAFTDVHQTISDIQWGGKAVQKVLRQSKARMLPFEDFWSSAVRFKFILIVPGVTQSSSLTNALRSGSVPVMVSHPTYEYLFPSLEPWVHYVPIQADLSDLQEIMQKLIGDDVLARSIAENAQQLAEQRLRPEATYCYLWHSLDRLQNLTVADQDELIQKSLDSFTEVPLIDLKMAHPHFKPLKERLGDNLQQCKAV
eukprot:TRINITY_DN19890_c0_g1_i1.p1 TRINITY_DN19890_c0_g1~~TRINITY_DN19890_c0_g1_i1.p1  ORF type:complete len:270 (-),score=30.81 TRINITY_DN19890_c0_g1_i1:21-830(-)